MKNYRLTYIFMKWEYRWEIIFLFCNTIVTLILNFVQSFLKKILTNLKKYVMLYKNLVEVAFDKE